MFEGKNESRGSSLIVLSDSICGKGMEISRPPDCDRLAGSDETGLYDGERLPSVVPFWGGGDCSMISDPSDSISISSESAGDALGCGGSA